MYLNVNGGVVRLLALVCMFWGFLLGTLNFRSDGMFLLATGLISIGLTILFTWTGSRQGRFNYVYALAAAISTGIGFGFTLFF